MYKGIELLNNGKTVDLSSLPKNSDGQLILEGVDIIKIVLENGATYNDKVKLLDNDSDVLISLTDASGANVEIILLSLSEILLQNNGEVPVFEVFQGIEKVASFLSLDELLEETGAGGNDTTTASASQTSDFDGSVGAGAQNSTADSGSGVDGFSRSVNLDATAPTYDTDISFLGNLNSSINEDFGQGEEETGILSGSITNNLPGSGTLPFVPQTTETEHGVFTIDAEGNWTYELFENGDSVQHLQVGESVTENFKVAVEGVDEEADVNVNITGVNDAPVFTPIGEQSTTEDGILFVSLDVSDVDGDNLSYEVTSTEGSVNVSADGIVTYKPDENYYGETEITVTVSDGNGGEVTQTFTVNVQGVNDLPEIATVNLEYAESDLLPEDTNSTLDVGEDSADNLNNYATDVDNDLAFSRNGDSLVLVIENNSEEMVEALANSDLGYVQLELVGLVTRTGISDAFDSLSDINFTRNDQGGVQLNILNAEILEESGLIDIVINEDGTYSIESSIFNHLGVNETLKLNFGYLIDDGTVQKEDTIGLTLTGVNDAPTMNTIEAQEVNEDEVLRIPLDIEDVDGDVVTPHVFATNGRAEVIDGEIIYTPDENYNGPATISIRIVDENGAESSQEIDVNVVSVNDLPVIDVDFGVTGKLEVLEDNALNIPFTVSDVESDNITTSVESTNGTVEIVDGEIVFTPDENYNGPVMVTIKAVDEDGGESTETLLVNVVSVNDAPSMNIIGAQDINEDEVLRVPLDIEDVDGDNITTTVEATNGTAEIIDGELVFTPDENYNGPATITITIEDENGAKTTQVIDINVASVNDLPLIDVAAQAEVNEDTVLNIPFTASDIDGDNITTSVEATNGTVEIVDGEIVFTPDENYNGTAEITLKAVDENGGETTQTIAVNILPVNDAPEAEAIVEDVASDELEDTPFMEDSAFLGKIEAFDVDGDDLTYAKTSVDSLVLNTTNPDLITAMDPDDPNLPYLKIVFLTLLSNPAIAALFESHSDTLDADTLVAQFLATSTIEEATAMAISTLQLVGVEATITEEGLQLTVPDVTVLEEEGVLSVEVQSDGNYSVVSPLFALLGEEDVASVLFGYSVDDGTVTVTESATINVSGATSDPVDPDPDPEPSDVSLVGVEELIKSISESQTVNLNFDTTTIDNFEFNAQVNLSAGSQTFFREEDLDQETFLIEFGSQFFSADPGQYIQVYIPNDSGDTYRVSSLIELDLDQWYDIKVTYEAGVGATIYVDGEDVTLYHQGTAGNAIVEDSIYYIVGTSTNSDRTEEFNGEYREVSLSYNDDTNTEIELFNSDGVETLSIEGSQDTAIDMAELLSNTEGLADGGADELSLLSGTHILSNITIEDVLTITDSDNTLEISGDAGDKLLLNLGSDVTSVDEINSGDPLWHKDLSASTDTETVYIGKTLSDETITLLINGVNVEEIL